MSGDPEQEYFADGVAEDVLTTLSKIQELMVCVPKTLSELMT